MHERQRYLAEKNPRKQNRRKKQRKAQPCHAIRAQRRGGGLVRTADMCIAYVRVMSVSVDVSIAWGILMFIWGVNLAPKCRNLLLVRTADMCIAHVRVMSVSVDVSIAWEILMFIWGTT